MQTDVEIKWMIRRDMPQVLAIEAASFEFPWAEEEFIRCLRQRNCIGMVAMRGEREILGYMIYALHKHKMELLNLCVHPDHVFEGIGAQMIAKLATKLSPQRRTKITCQVREGNTDAQLFFRATGFVATGMTPGAYDECDEDAIEFERCLSVEQKNDEWDEWAAAWVAGAMGK